MDFADDTIIAIATPPGEGAVGMVRISGAAAAEVAGRIFRSKKRELSPSAFESHRLYWGEILDGGEVIDEVMACLMRAPNSYTREDSIEIYSHGSPFVLKRIVAVALSCGARHAQPGEFTKRAFLNGRLDLSQAEAVIDLVQAKSELQRKYALRQLRGEFSRDLMKIREDLFNVLVKCSANIDFPDDVPKGVSRDQCLQALDGTSACMVRLLEGARTFRIIKEGFSVVLMGEPNVGKSSLLNALAGQEVAIVTEVPGTTRDAVHYEVLIRGIPVSFVDTAGLREPENIVERRGIELTRRKYDEADLVLWILDGSTPRIQAAAAQPYLANGKDAMIVVNKVDLPRMFQIEHVRMIFPHRHVYETSAVTGAGVSELKAALDAWVSDHSALMECQYALNIRHHEMLEQSFEHLMNARHAMEQDLGEDLVASDLRCCLERLDEILGFNVSEEMIESIFSRFCIGK